MIINMSYPKPPGEKDNLIALHCHLGSALRQAASTGEHTTRVLITQEEGELFLKLLHDHISKTT